MCGRFVRHIVVVVCCMLYAVCCMLYAVCCMLYAILPYCTAILLYCTAILCEDSSSTTHSAYEASAKFQLGVSISLIYYRAL